jgi:uncharacterized protein YjiS (DUF1127 family)
MGFRHIRLNPKRAGNRVAPEWSGGQISPSLQGIEEATMASIHDCAPAAQPPFFAALAGRLAGFFRNVALALKHRRDAAMLAGMDEHMLRDIGLNRSDLRDAYAEPLWRDPTDILAARVKDRRRSRPGVYRKVSFASPPLVPHDGFTVPNTNRPSRHTV